ncbi:MAG: hypothetical protein Q8N23_05910 [Archangium sp.]|nr:hypothetical protein [Archangium sp.]
MTAPTIGFSGTLWIAGPLALEGTQLLDDQGVVDGVAHRDIFLGPYSGLGFAL